MATHAIQPTMVWSSTSSGRQGGQGPLPFAEVGLQFPSRLPAVFLRQRQQGLRSLTGPARRDGHGLEPERETKLRTR